MKKIMLILVLLFGLLKADENTLKLVLDLTTSDLGKFERTVLKGISITKANYESQLQELEVVVVIHGGSYKYFLKDLISSPFSDDEKLLKVKKEFAIRIKSLHDTYDVKFLICEAGLNSRHIKKENVFDFVELIPNAMMGLIDTQNNGYAYVPVR